jgi:hypothetical protein
MTDKSDRRGFMNKTLLGAAIAGAAFGLEERQRLSAAQQGTGDGQKPRPEVDPAAMPCGKIGNVTISRLFLGGNVIGGWAHSRDLLYVSKLFKAYNTEAKILDTLELAERCGINTILLDPRDWATVLKYRKERKGKIQTMICTLPDTEESKMGEHVKQVVDQGANLVYVHGIVGDQHTMTGRIDALGRAIDLIKAQGVPAGVGGHSLQTPMACEKNRLNPDFYVKTFHMDRYWSATPKEHREEWCWYKAASPDHGRYHDNMFCLDAAQTASFMETVAKPWVAFKVMAAGAIPPRAAFSNAYRNGADFIVAGMFDFQIEEDAKIAIEAVRKFEHRQRPWRA